MRLNGLNLNIKIGDLIKQRKTYWDISKEGVKRDGFFEGILIEPEATKQMIRFPLYKTVEEYLFYKN